MPVGILGSLGDLHAALHARRRAVMVGLAPYTVLRDQPAPMVVGAAARGDAQPGGAAASWLGVLKGLVEIGALAGTDLGRDGDDAGAVADLLCDGDRRPAARRGRARCIRAGARRTSRRSSPALGVAIAAGLTPIWVLGQLVSIGTLFAFVVVSIGVLVLRRTSPDLPRPFRVPFVPWLPIAVGGGLPRVDGEPAVGDVGAPDRLDGGRAGRSTRPTATAAACCGRPQARREDCRRRDRALETAP